MELFDREWTMGNTNAVKIAAIVLIVAGALGLAYGGFAYTKGTHEAKLGPFAAYSAAGTLANRSQELSSP